MVGPLGLDLGLSGHESGVCFRLLSAHADVTAKSHSRKTIHTRENGVNAVTGAVSGSFPVGLLEGLSEHFPHFGMPGAP